MTGRAERIFAGRCVDAQVTRDASLGFDVTTLTFEVTRAVKGGQGDRVTVKVLGRGAGIVGMPRFRPGEEVVLFLYGESALGLSSPVGLGQGKFSVFEDKLGRRRAVNSHGNKTLFRELSPRARGRLGPAASRWKGRQSIPPDELLDLVESLVLPAAGEVQRRTPHGRGEGRTREAGR
jgi:hypothetical protein